MSVTCIVHQASHNEIKSSREAHVQPPNRRRMLRFRRTFCFHSYSDRFLLSGKEREPYCRFLASVTLYECCQSLSFCRRKSSPFYASKPFMKIRSPSTFIRVSLKELCVENAAKDPQQDTGRSIPAACHSSIRLWIRGTQNTSHSVPCPKFYASSACTAHSGLCDATCTGKRCFASPCDCG